MTRIKINWMYFKSYPFANLLQVVVTERCLTNEMHLLNKKNWLTISFIISNGGVVVVSTPLAAARAAVSVQLPKRVIGVLH